MAAEIADERLNLVDAMESAQKIVGKRINGGVEVKRTDGRYDRWSIVWALLQIGISGILELAWTHGQWRCRC